MTDPKLAIGVLLVLLAVAPGAAGQEWTQWRGPGRDGFVSEKNAPAAWPDKLQRAWRVEIDAYPELTGTGAWRGHGLGTRLMQAAGYQTALFGKWHLKTQPVGFDRYDALPLEILAGLHL